MEQLNEPVNRMEYEWIVDILVEILEQECNPTLACVS